ncbi:MAG: leucine-rich repeat protein [Paludibacteraceae bacterium]|nr:leucine-rich repeat protein [Paludibacteraceae bacterium]
MANSEKPIEKSIVIPEEGSDMTSIGGFCFSDNKSIETVVIREGVTEIEYYAFNSCKNLISVTLPTTLNRICENAFSYCPKLANISLPEGLTRIDDVAFSECLSLTEMRLPDSVEKLGRGVFWSCRNLKKVVLPKSLKELPYDSFKNASALEEVVFPQEMQTLGVSAFMYCSSLTSIELPEGIETLNTDVFSRCTKLASVKLPKSLKIIKSRAFEGCDSLKEVEIPANVEMIKRDSFPPATKITISPDNPHIRVENGFLLSADGKVLIACLTDAETVQVPESVTEIGESAFERCGQLASVTLGKNVVTLGKSCFSRCTSLRKVKDTEGLLKMGESAFYECSKLETFYFPESLASLENGAFYDCSRLSDITIPASLRVIGTNAFRNCKNLNSITIPATVDQVGYYAFAGSGLSNVTLLSKANLGDEESGYVFAFCKSLKEIKLPSQVISYHTFDGCQELTSVTFLNSVSKIRTGIFSDCPKLSVIHVSALNKDVDVKTFVDYNKTEEILLDGDDKGWLCEVDAGIAKLRKTANAGDAEAQHRLAYRYYKGEGVPKSNELAVEWWTKAAMQGLAVAQYNLGICYEGGEGVPKNSKNAVEWYAKAAEQGYVNAQNQLGLCYQKGVGVAPNYEKAAEWFRKAAKLRNKYALDNLRKLKEMGLIAPDNALKITDDLFGELYHDGKNSWKGKSAAEFLGKDASIEIELEGSGKDGIAEAQRVAYAEYLEKQSSFFERLQQKAKENFKAVVRRKKDNRIVPYKLYIARDGNYGWCVVKEWDGGSIAAILSDDDVQMAKRERILRNIADVKESRTRKKWKMNDTAYLNLFGLLIDLSIMRSGYGSDDEDLTDEEVEVLKWLTTEFDTNTIKQDVLDYCNDTYNSWGGEHITADELHNELSISKVYLNVEEAENHEKFPDICLSGDCNCDEEHGIAFAFKNKKLIEINEESIAF